MALAAGVSTAAERGAGRRGGAVVGSGTIEKYSRRSADWRRAQTGFQTDANGIAPLRTEVVNDESEERGNAGFPFTGGRRRRRPDRSRRAAGVAAELRVSVRDGSSA